MDFVQMIKFICAVNLHVRFIQICEEPRQIYQTWENVELTHGAMLDVADGPYVGLFFLVFAP